MKETTCRKLIKRDKGKYASMVSDSCKLKFELGNTATESS